MVTYSVDRSIYMVFLLINPDGTTNIQLANFRKDMWFEMPFMFINAASIVLFFEM
jgi:hypothetical protein